jgi:outer membrane protein insertion porin family
MTRTTAPRLLAIALAAALALPQPSAAQALQPFVVSDIRIEGLQRIAAGTVFTYLPIERGQRMDSQAAGDAIRALFATGFFSDVKLERQNDILVVTVQERPAINKITLVGNKDIKTDDLMKGLKDIGLAEGETFDRLDLDRVTQELIRQYNNRGKYNATIKPSIANLDRNRVDITIDVKEGKAAKVRHINIVGNTKFDEEDLRDGWESDTSNWLSWYRRDDQYSREKLSGDLEKLSEFYLDRGYAQFAIESSQVSLSPDKKDVYITASISEGEVYKVKSVEVTGDTILPKEQIDGMVFLRKGATFSRRVMEFSSDAITAALSNIGYAFAKVTPIPDIDNEKKEIGIKLFVEPGQRVHVRRIVFKGNVKTADEVMRREMRQFEGAWYSQAAIDRSKVRLQRTGYFEEVDIETPPVPGVADQVDVVVSFKERSAGQFIFGLGFSQLAGITTSIAVTQDNFLGTGNRISVAVSNNTFSKSINFGFSDPYFTDDGISIGYNLQYSEFNSGDANTAQFSSNTIAARSIFGIPLSETDSISAALGIDSREIFAIRGFTPDELVDYIERVGNRTFHSVRAELAWARDSRNHFFVPTRGTFQRLGVEVVLPGSTQEFYKVTYDGSRLWPLSRHLVVQTSASLGYGEGYGNAKSNGLPFFENFFTGGTNSIRGFRDNTLGPTATVSGSTFQQPIGGSVKTVGNIEMIFPTLFKSESTRISAFVDFGNVFRRTSDVSLNEFRASTGLSMQWQAPVGPIVISYAKPIRTKDGDRTEQLQFTFGGRF